MIALLIALLTAAGNGATNARPAEIPTDSGILAAVEYTAPQCPTFEDEACYVIVYADLTVEVGP